MRVHKFPIRSDSYFPNRVIPMEPRRIRPIRNDIDYARVLDMLADLEAMSPQPGSSDADLMDVLSMQAENYRTAWLKRTLPDAVSAIQFAMAERGLTQADLATVLGSRSRASEILAGKRGLSIEHIRRLHSAWSIPAELLIKE